MAATGTSNSIMAMFATGSECVTHATNYALYWPFGGSELGFAMRISDQEVCTYVATSHAHNSRFGDPSGR